MAYWLQLNVICMFLSHGTFTQNGKQTRKIFSKCLKRHVFDSRSCVRLCYCWTKPMKVFCLFSSDKDVCVKVVMLAKINKWDTSSRSLVWLFGRWRVNWGSGCTAATTSPLNVNSWKPATGELPSCSSGSRTRSHFTQCTKSGSPHTPSGPHSLCIRLLTPPFLRSLLIPFPSLPFSCLLEIHPHTERSLFLLTFAAPALPVEALEADIWPN